MVEALLTTTIPEGELLSRGKVRDIYSADDALVLVATDRISAFDHVLDPGIPGRGIVLTQLSNFWFERLAHVIPNHVLATDVSEFPAPFRSRTGLAGRSILARRLAPIPVECVARGFITGSGWKEYLADSAVCGVPLHRGLAECEKLPEPIFTPATKAVEGHDENISFDRMVDVVGGETAERLRDVTLTLYTEAASYAAERGILIADTKFEFGFDQNGVIVWMDEALTPDSSRFWPAEAYRPGRSQPSFDKQFVRDWLAESGWDREPPAPTLPPHIVEETLKRYRRVFSLLTGQDLDI